MDVFVLTTSFGSVVKLINLEVCFLLGIGAMLLSVSFTPFWQVAIVRSMTMRFVFPGVLFQRLWVSIGALK